MYCKTHKLPMTQLLTSWVCDVCHPPEVLAAPAETPVDVITRLAAHIAKVGPAPSLEAVCQDGYRWSRWNHDIAELNLPPNFDYYYFNHKINLGGNVDNLRFTASVIYGLNGEALNTDLGLVTTIKSKLHNAHGRHNFEVSKTCYAALEAASCYANLNFNRGYEKVVFFWAR